MELLVIYLVTIFLLGLVASVEVVRSDLFEAPESTSIYENDQSDITVSKQQVLMTMVKND